MEKKQVIHTPIGMNRDTSISKVDSTKYAYENKNVRIVSNEEGTYLTLCNEQGTKSYPIYYPSFGETTDNLASIVLGVAEFSDCFILFTTIVDAYDEKQDDIYKCWIDKHQNRDKVFISRIFSGDLGFNVNNPIETLAFIENGEKKIYWVDGINSPRVINVDRANYSENIYDFIPKLKLQEKVIVSKDYSKGTFHSGVIQYALSYYRYLGQESNIFYTSPLYYITNKDRGGSPEELFTNSFKIEINNLDNLFDFVRIYSIHRTSIDATPEVKIVADLNIKSLNSLTYIDTGTNGTYIDPTQLLYIGGKDLVAGTLSTKDLTMFLGNLEIKSNIVKSTTAELCKDIEIGFKTRDDRYITNGVCEGYYPYTNQLGKNSQQIKTFKYLEYYRLGLQAQDSKGSWSNPIFIKDIQNTTPIKSSIKEDKSLLPYAEGIVNSSIVNELISQGYTKIRPVIVYPSIYDRSCLCQGVLCPTVYSENDRTDNSPFSQSSWFFRPNAPFELSSDKKYGRGYRIYRAYINALSQASLQEGDEVYIDSSLYGTYTINHIGNGIEYSNGSALPIYYIELKPKNKENNKDYPEFPLRDSSIIRVSDNYEFYYSKIDYFWENDYAFFKGTSGSQYNLKYSKIGIITNTKDSIRYDNGNIGELSDIYKKGAFVEFRHLYKLPDNTERNAEIQCDNDFYIDQSIVTLHSPEIELDDALLTTDLSNVKLRIIGVVPLTSFESTLDIQPSNPAWYSKDVGLGFNNFKVSSDNSFSPNISTAKDSFFGYRGLVSGPFWLDRTYNAETDAGNNPYVRGFVVYPWHRNGSLNNADNTEEQKAWITNLKKKTLKNRKFSYNSIYFNIGTIWEAFDESNTIKTGIKDIKIFNSSENVAMKLKAPDNYINKEILYYGNIDKIITSNSGYKIIHTIDTDNSAVLTSPDKLFSSDYDVYNSAFSKDPVSMQYKSNRHAVIVLNSSSEEYDIVENNNKKQRKQQVLPTLYDSHKEFIGSETSSSLYPINDVTDNVTISNNARFWENQVTGIYQEPINVLFDLFDNKSSDNAYLNLGHGWLWLGELYRDDIANRFGGTTDAAIENNQWLPCGEAVILNEGNNATLNWEEGDTYYQRYDHIKTFPKSVEDQNSIMEMVSFMCESRINLDSKYDDNRKSLDTILFADNFNKINSVYSQQNNFFNYRGYNYEFPNISKYQATITWSKTKTLGEYIDTWTNITLASTLDLDINLGKISSIKKLNNDLIVLQDKGVSQILYNERVQISPTVGVPIEIANSGKVDGIYYLYSNIGCSNKWGTCTTKNGVYFFDGNSKSLYFLNREKQISNISESSGFNTWFNSNTDNLIWDPYNFNGCILQYDSINSDVLLITKYNCLAYSEKLQTFTSFYDYDNVSNYVSYKDKVFLIKAYSGEEYGLANITKVYGLQEGSYNNFFGEYKPFYTTIMVNEHPTADKIFTNVEYRADSYIGDTIQHNLTFDTLETWNEYQYGRCDLINTLGYPSSLKKKFRVWRANIPRDNSNGRDRMRNPWLYLRLGKINFTDNVDDSSNRFKLQLHDIVVDYYE